MAFNIIDVLIMVGSMQFLKISSKIVGVCLLLLFFGRQRAICQTGLEELYDVDYYTVVFWNIENFFDTRPHPQHNDKEFTPSGANRWTWKRFARKREGISKTLMSIDPWSVNLPAIIGLAEVENRFVLNQLLYETPLFMGDYRIVHKDSPDSRGIDVALLYRKSMFRALEMRFMPVKVSETGLSGNTDSNLSAALSGREFSRDILYVKGVLHQLDTLHLFVNHWPSKYGGEKISNPKREAAAMVLSGVCDSILDQNIKANILVMGDFNDTPESRVFELLQGLRELPLIGGEAGQPNGTIKYMGGWEKIDHFFTSSNLLDNNEPISVSPKDGYIYCNVHLLEKDRKYTGQKPKRTYIGPRYNGGLSDHLPIVVRIMRNW